MKKILYLLSFLLLTFSIGFLYLVYLQWHKSKIYSDICDLVNQKIYLSEEQTKNWYQLCQYQSQNISFNTTGREMIRSLNSYFELLNVSHLKIFSTEENNLIWKGKSYGSGIDSKYVDGDLVILNVEKNSPADLAGLKRGDIVETLNGELTSDTELSDSVGNIRISRKNKKLNINLQAKEFILNQEIKVEVIKNSIALIKVPSFHSMHFEGDWDEIIRKIRPYKKYILDFRGNHGGNFVAGLRFLSPLLCGEKEIGYFVKSKTQSLKESNLPNDLDDEKQIELIDASNLVHLVSFKSEFCLPAESIVLVDSDTASVAEMVAQALKDYMGAKIWGQPSAGKVLVGIWYPMDTLERGVRISIPEAVYQTKRGKQIEGEGISIDKNLNYHLKDLQSQKDSWVESAVSELYFY